MKQLITIIDMPEIDTGTLYDEIAFRLFLESNDLNNLSTDEQNALLDLWDKKKETGKYFNESDGK